MSAIGFVCKSGGSASLMSGPGCLWYTTKSSPTLPTTTAPTTTAISTFLMLSPPSLSAQGSLRLAEVSILHSSSLISSQSNRRRGCLRPPHYTSFYHCLFGFPILRMPKVGIPHSSRIRTTTSWPCSDLTNLCWLPTEPPLHCPSKSLEFALSPDFPYWESSGSKGIPNEIVA